ncbi:MAG: carboxyl transferase domain-containing protein, partial [Myxococcota bacterium]
MDILPSQVRTDAPEFEANAAHHKGLAEQLRSRLATVRKGGSDAAIAKHKSRGKLMVRDRIDALIDEDSPFLELSPLAAWGRHDDQAPAAGLVTGIGSIVGRECLIIANDATVKGGTYFPETVKKHVR